jgi:meso-butanediol dehydrogenase/(S,S)-butanediol dehydrogenase/diacetyl reductase
MAEGERFPPAFLTELERITPLRRRGTPDEVAKAILFLASDDASFITGQVLTLAGGRTALTAGTLIHA